jgi:hypothetical protein
MGHYLKGRVKGTNKGTNRLAAEHKFRSSKLFHNFTVLDHYDNIVSLY